MADEERYEIKPPIEVDLRDNPGPVRFDTFDEVLDWAKSQEQELAGLFGDGVINKWNTAQNQVNEHRRILGLIRSHAQKRERDPIANLLESKFRPGQIIHLDSADGELIKAVVHNSDPAAALALYVFISASRSGLNFPAQNQVEFVGALFRGLLMHAGRVGTTAERTALRRLHTEFGNALSEQHQERQEAAARLEEVISDGRARLGALEERMAGLEQNEINHREEIRSELQNKVANFKAQLDGIENQFKNRMSLAAAESHWGKKRRRHFIAAFLSAAVFALLGAAVVVAAVFGAIPLFDSMMERIARTEELNGGVLPPAVATLLVGVPLFLGVWLLRLVSRLLVTNLAHHADASDRVSMLATYLSLVQEKRIESEADRILILQALFRPGAAQTHDDTAPPTAFDILLQRISDRRIS